MRFLAVALASAALLGALAVSPVSAQYPQPGEPITITPSDSTPGVGETISLSIEVSDDQAARISGDRSDVILASALLPGSEAEATTANLAVFSCTAAVSGGSGATVSPSSFNTDDQGRATLSLYTGTQAGTLTVGVDCGTTSAQVVLQVQPTTAVAGERTPGAGTGTGTGTGSGTPAAPSTGTGTSGGDTSALFWVLSAAGVAALGAGAAMVARRRA